jgi:hypothetical protein
MRYSKSKSVRYGLFLVAIAAGSTACTTVQTAVKLKDPSKTAVSFRRAGRSTVRPIDPGSNNVSTSLASVGVKKDATISREGLAIKLDCSTCDSGNLTLLSDDKMTAPGPYTVSELIESRKIRKGILNLEYRYDVSSSQNLTPVLETHWSNAEYFEESREPVRALGWLLVPGGFLTAAGVYLLFQSPAAGVAAIIPGLALAAWGGWQLIMEPSSERIGLDGKAIAQVTPAPTALEAEPAAEEAAPAKEEKATEEEAPPPTAAKAEKAVKVEEQEAKKPAKEPAAEKAEKPEKKAAAKKEEPEEEKPAKATKKKQAEPEDEDDFFLKDNDKKPSKPAPPPKEEEKNPDLDLL